MARAPPNVIPTWIIQVLQQTGVALNRIAMYLGEDKISEQRKLLVFRTDRSNEMRRFPKADPDGAGKGKDKDGKTSLAYLPFFRIGWIETQSDEQVYYKIKRSTELKQLMGVYAARVGKDVSTLRCAQLFLL
ncbi:hypothetical protein DXG01_011787 [Tephrocybe rancida]|nr:hypothetical protein DXG01_011787 [Tephrocybe rancida]